MMRVRKVEGTKKSSLALELLRRCGMISKAGSSNARILVRSILVIASNDNSLTALWKA